MLFLAVTLGFFVENEREHYIEHLRARQYAASLADDLESDTLAFGKLINNYNSDISKGNELRKILKERPITSIPGGSLYYYCEPTIWVHGITFHDATIQQLKNSGNLRYLSVGLQYLISEYDRKIREISMRLENELHFSRITREMMTDIFDSESIISINGLRTTAQIEEFKQKDLKFLKKDTLLLRKLLNEVIYRHASWQYRLKDIIEPANTAASELLARVKKEYRLD
jgi:hypothetical protein